ncbi:MAG: hypothetical protein JWQ25_3301 [Daejeonella sp.]|nr:hypothetical protein [Daejeonella sp.]
MTDKPIDPYNSQKIRFADSMNEAEKNTATKLILVIVANTIDPEIGKGCREDIKSIRHMFEELSKHMKFNFLELVVAEADYSKKNILDVIEILTPGYNDIVVFYYSGHGFSYEKDAEKQFPQIDMRSHPASNDIDVINNNTQNLMDLFELVKGRGARLNIVIGDCCNSLIKFKRNFKGGDDKIRSAERPPIIINKQTCEALFCDYTASILVAAADKGEYAVSDEELGSIFTFNFTNNLKILMNKAVDPQNGLPWGKLLEETQEMTHELSKTYDIGDGKPGNQKAIFDIRFRETLY